MLLWLSIKQRNRVIIIKRHNNLFKTRRFLPIFLTQFLGAFNDNLFKNALVILITFRLAERYNVNAQILITIVAGLFILPFFLFSSLAGELADKYEKSFLIHIIKFVEIILMVLTAFAFQTSSMWMLIGLLFLMGAQSSFFGPLKYSILPQHLLEYELVAGNGLVNAGTFIAIITGTLIGGLFILSEYGTDIISVGIVGVAVLGFIFSLFIPKAIPPDPNLKISLNIPVATKNIIRTTMVDKTVFRSILGISWFWFLGAVFLAQFPVFTKDVLGGNEEVTTFFLAIFSAGIVAGSVICDKLLSGKVSGKLIPFALTGVSVSIFVLCCFSFIVEKTPRLIDFATFIKLPSSIGITIGFFCLAMFGGMYTVPLYAIMQAKSTFKNRARIIATSNITDSVGMVISAFFVTLLLIFKVSITGIFFIMGIINVLLTPILSEIGKMICND